MPRHPTKKRPTEPKPKPKPKQSGKAKTDKRPPAPLRKRDVKRKRRMIRRSEDGDGLTRSLKEALVDAIAEDRLPRKYAATVNGVSPRTFELWITMGAAGAGTPLHAELARDVYEAEGAHVGQQMRNLHSLGQADPKAAVAFLQFFKPLDFGGTPPAGDEFQEPARNAQRQDLLLSNPPPRMLAKFRQHGWWRFATEMEEEDRMVLIALQEKYAARMLTDEHAIEAASTTVP